MTKDQVIKEILVIPGHGHTKRVIFRDLELYYSISTGNDYIINEIIRMDRDNLL